MWFWNWNSGLHACIESHPVSSHLVSFVQCNVYEILPCCYMFSKHTKRTIVLIASIELCLYPLVNTWAICHCEWNCHKCSSTLFHRQISSCSFSWVTPRKQNGWLIGSACFNIARNCQMFFPKWLPHFTWPPAMHKRLCTFAHWHSCLS